MNKKIQNVIILGVFLLMLYLATLSSYFRADILYPSILNENTSFDGLIFDQPVNVSNLSIVRSIEQDQERNLYKYDVSFNYTGDPSDLRILNTPVRQIYFPEGVYPSRSNANLKGEYDKVNQSISESLNLKDMYKIDGDFKFLAKSEIRVPLDEKIGDYQFSVYTEPRDFSYQGGKKLSDIGIFITNAKADKFTDNLGLKEQNLKPVTNTKTQSGIFINSLELINANNVKWANLVNKISTAVFILSIIFLLLSMAIMKARLKILSLLALNLSILSLPGMLNKGMSNMAILLILPIFSYLAYVVVGATYQPKLRVEKKTFKQALASMIIFFLVSILLFIVPRGL